VEKTLEILEIMDNLKVGQIINYDKWYGSSLLFTLSIKNQIS